MDKDLTQKMGLWGGVIGVIIVAIFVMLYFASNKGNEVVAIGSVPKAVSAEDWVSGDVATAKAVLIEYSDFQCPSCALSHPIVKQVQAEFKDKLAFVYRYFPLSMIHKNAMPSSIAAEAAGKQGKFWEMHDMLFEKQRDWSEEIDTKNTFIGYAKTLGLDVNKFTTDLDSPEIKNKIEASFKEGSAIGVAGTPTFYLNGKKMQASLSFEEFKAEIAKNI